MVTVHKGEKVVVVTADNRAVERRAVSEVVAGANFPVVWVCLEEEWDKARRENRPPSGLPWPAESVRRARNANDTT